MKKSVKLCSLLMIALAAQISFGSAATIGYWRFESGNVTGDSGPNGLNLSAYTGGTAVTPISYSLPASGAGSHFPTTIAQTGAANASAIQGPGTNNIFGSAGYYKAADASAFSIATAMSVEAFINPTTIGAAQVIAAQGANGTGGAWAFGLNSAGSLFFQFMNSSGTWGQAGIFSNNNTGGITLTAGKDYYVGYTLTLSDTGTTGATFYIKNLTDGGALQIVNSVHTGTTMFDSTLSVNIGAANDSALGFTGVIDELRLSNSRLSQSELLISVPEPTSYALMVLGVFVLLVGSRRKLCRQRV